MANQSETIKAYLCSFKLGSISYSLLPPNPLGPSDISVSVGKVAAPLIPSPTGRMQTYVTAKMNADEDVNPHFCKAADGFKVRINIDQSGWPLSARILYHNPETCDWIRTIIIGEHYGVIHEVTNMESWSGPIPKDKKDVLVCPKGERTVDTLSLVPGERVDLCWQFQDYQLGDIIVSASAWFTTKCLTGGWVRSITEACTNTQRRFVVYIEGKTYLLSRTDFYPYQVGDWVFVRRDPGTEFIDNYGTSPWDANTPISGRTAECPPFSGNGIIVPLQIRGIGAYYF
jgi:hypothetical protein